MSRRIAVRAQLAARAQSPQRMRPLREALRQCPPPAGAYGPRERPAQAGPRPSAAALATPYASRSGSRLRTRCELPVGVFLGRRAPSGESPGSLGAGLRRGPDGSQRPCVACCSSAWRRSSGWTTVSRRRTPPASLLVQPGDTSPGSGRCPAAAHCSTAASMPARRCRPLRLGGRRAEGGGPLCALRPCCCRFRPATPFEYLAKIPLDCANWTQFGRIRSEDLGGYRRPVFDDQRHQAQSSTSRTRPCASGSSPVGCPM